MPRERVKCQGCGEYLVSAVGSTGLPMDEEGVVTFFKMIKSLQAGGSLPMEMDDIVCGACGSRNFDIVTV